MMIRASSAWKTFMQQKHAHRITEVSYVLPTSLFHSLFDQQVFYIGSQHFNVFKKSWHTKGLTIVIEVNMEHKKAMKSQYTTQMCCTSVPQALRGCLKEVFHGHANTLRTRGIIFERHHCPLSRCNSIICYHCVADLFLLLSYKKLFCCHHMVAIQCHTGFLNRKI